jgi:hypothetical protein
MRLFGVASTASIFLTGALCTHGLQNDVLAAKALAKLTLYTATNGFPSETCNLKNVAVRREW